MLQSLFRDVTKSLSAVYDQREARTVAFMLLESLLHVSRVDVLADKDITFSSIQRNQLQGMLDRLVKHEPVQYVLGEAEFCGLTLEVSPDVLIPRPETEELVQWVCDDFGDSSMPISIVDVCTGSGCIALSLAHRFTGSCVRATDISEAALAVARRNAHRLSLSVGFRQADALGGDPFGDTDDQQQPMFDVVVSNPPYIRRSERGGMEANVLDYEPEMALFVPDDSPMLFYEAIARAARNRLKDGGALYFEINSALGPQTLAMLSALGYSRSELRKDLYGNDRMVRGRL
ncbi:MAG: peptide chain release factor N(5)-glutamine methyltransferase [Bacteroidaceae bacterium]|nr:peptide chain release factor N(5)-glutamine methyltransferase [Bacteroidaceae bacterium]